MASHSIACPHYIVFVRSSIGGHLGCFHLLVIVNNAAMNMVYNCVMVVTVLQSCFSSFGYIPRSGIAG